MGVLQVGRRVAEIDDSILELAAPCCYLDVFRNPVPSELPPLRVREVQALHRGAATPLDGVSRDGGAYAVEGDEILVRIPRSPASAEASLRAVFQVATMREGGLLVHGSGVAFEGRALVAVGESGAGKSTLARLCLAAGAELLSDETIGLYPDGTAWGSPFFSDHDLAGRRLRASLGAIFLLEKAEREQVSPVDPAEGAGALLAQVYRPGPGELNRAELLSRAAALAVNPGVRRFRFRRELEAGAFVKGWLLESAG